MTNTTVAPANAKLLRELAMTMLVADPDNTEVPHRLRALANALAKLSHGDLYDLEGLIGEYMTLAEEVAANTPRSTPNWVVEQDRNRRLARAKSVSPFVDHLATLVSDAG